MARNLADVIIGWYIYGGFGCYPDLVRPCRWTGPDEKGPQSFSCQWNGRAFMPVVYMYTIEPMRFGQEGVRISCPICVGRRFLYNCLIFQYVNLVCQIIH